MEGERNKQPSHCLREFLSTMLMINQLKKQNDRDERACTDKLRARGSDNRNALGFGWSCFTKQD